jgi:hypothetical protein
MDTSAPPKLANVLELGRPAVRLIQHGDPIPLVKKLEHPGRGMNRLAASAELAAQSRQEILRLQDLYGRTPW